MLSNDLRDIPPSFIGEFGELMGERGLRYKKEPFKLRAGGESHWYFDGRRALGNGFMTSTVGLLMVQFAEIHDIDADVVVGQGCGGAPVYMGMMVHAQNLRWATVNSEFNPERPESVTNQRILGAHVNGRRVLVVDDTLSTGSSLIETVEAVRADGGIVENTLTVVDRSRGAALPALSAIGVTVDSLYELDESAGKITPKMF